MKKRLFSGCLIALLGFGLPASAGPERGDFMIVVPVDISGLSPTVTHGRLRCFVETSGGRRMGNSEAKFKLEQGGFSGNVRVHIRPGGYPAGVDPVPDGRSAKCNLFFDYACTSSTGSAGSCMTALGVYMAADNPARSLFTPKPGEQKSVRINAEFDSTEAPRLPRRYN